MSGSRIVNVLYLLHSDERSAPEVVRNAAEVRCMRCGVEPDLSIKQFDPAAIMIGAPFDHEAQIALERVSTLMLPTVGFGTGHSDRLMCNVSAAIEIQDLRAVLELLASPATICSGPAAKSANGVGMWLRHSADDFAMVLENLLALRIPDYRDRAERVVQACLWIGSHLGMGGEELNTLLLAARLREIGKLGLPDLILFTHRKDRTSEDQTLYDRYPALGAKVLCQFPIFLGAAKIIEYHLENFDGTGAQNLASHQIPLGSRILRVAGAFEMISADTGIRARDEVIRILGRGRGSLFDPMLVALVENYAALATAAADSSHATRRVRLSDLHEGMILAEDIWSRTGMKIIGAGTRLNEHILRILLSLPLDMAIESVEIQRDN